MNLKKKTFSSLFEMHIQYMYIHTYIYIFFIWNVGYFNGTLGFTVISDYTVKATLSFFRK